MTEIRYPVVRLVPQINGTVVGAANCGPCTAAMTVDFATGGRIRISPYEARRRMGVLTGPTGTLDQEKCVESFDVEAIHVGLKPLQLTRHWHGAWSDCLAAIMSEKKWLGLVIDYGTINDDPVGKKLSGDKAFRDLHFLGGFGVRGSSSGRQIKIWDPLADGRRPGIPNGPTWWPLDLIHKAMNDGAGGHGLASWTVTDRADRLPKAADGHASVGHHE